jgi:hypothetical protein
MRRIDDKSNRLRPVADHLRISSCSVFYCIYLFLNDSIILRTGFFSAMVKFIHGSEKSAAAPENGAGYGERENTVPRSNIKLAFSPAGARATERRIA